MEKTNFKTLIEETRNNFKIAIDDLFNVIEIISEELEKINPKNQV